MLLRARLQLHPFPVFYPFQFVVLRTISDKISGLGQPEADTIASPWVVPVYRSFVTNDVAGTTLKAGFVNDTQQPCFFTIRVAIGWASLDAGTMIT